MTYATKQLTEALQELMTRNADYESKIGPSQPEIITAQHLQFSQEVQAFLEDRQEYKAKTRTVSEGSY